LQAPIIRGLFQQILFPSSYLMLFRQFETHYLLISLIILTTCFYLVLNAVSKRHVLLSTFVCDLVTNGVRACDSFL